MSDRLWRLLGGLTPFADEVDVGLLEAVERFHEGDEADREAAVVELVQVRAARSNDPTAP